MYHYRADDDDEDKKAKTSDGDMRKRQLQTVTPFSFCASRGKRGAQTNMKSWKKEESVVAALWFLG